MTHLRVERDLCIGAANCLRVAPGVFELDEQDLAVVVDAGAAPVQALQRAVDTCPAGAIYLDGDEPAAEAAGETP